MTTTLSPDQPVTLDAFAEAVLHGGKVSVSPDLRTQLVRDAAHVEAHLDGGPVYGLNTGLGANLGHRIAPEDIAKHQMRILHGRACATGPALPEWAGRGVTLYRILTAGRGGSGMSPVLFDHLRHALDRDPPAIPRFGSIGASDLVQNACWALGVLGDSGPELGPRDAMALINHPGLSTTFAAVAVHAMRRVHSMAMDALALSYVGYGANPAILSAEANSARNAPGQAATATRLRTALIGCEIAPRKPQEVLSFRTAHLGLGALGCEIERVAQIIEGELNARPDSPLISETGDMSSSPNFANPALAHGLDAVARLNTTIAHASIERAKRLMDPDLSGLPRYLSPVGGASAGFVPVQKTMAALGARVGALATPMAIDPAPVSLNVEDTAPMTFEAAHQLWEQTRVLHLLIGAEAMIGAQAIDLRSGGVDGHVGQVHRAIRDVIPPLYDDRPIGGDIEACADILDRLV